MSVVSRLSPVSTRHTHIRREMTPDSYVPYSLEHGYVSRWHRVTPCRGRRGSGLDRKQTAIVRSDRCPGRDTSVYVLTGPRTQLFGAPGMSNCMNNHHALRRVLPVDTPDGKVISLARFAVSVSLSTRTQLVSTIYSVTATPLPQREGTTVLPYRQTQPKKGHMETSID